MGAGASLNADLDGDGRVGGIGEGGGEGGMKAAKEAGDRAFRSGLFPEAVYWYSRALPSQLPVGSEATSNSSKNFNNSMSQTNDAKDAGEASGSSLSIREVSVLLSNRSAAFLSSLQPGAALRDAAAAIAIDPEW